MPFRRVSLDIELVSLFRKGNGFLFPIIIKLLGRIIIERPSFSEPFKNLVDEVFGCLLQADTIFPENCPHVLS